MIWIMWLVWKASENLHRIMRTSMQCWLKSCDRLKGSWNILRVSGTIITSNLFLKPICLSHHRHSCRQIRKGWRIQKTMWNTSWYNQKVSVLLWIMAEWQIKEANCLLQTGVHSSTSSDFHESGRIPDLARKAVLCQRRYSERWMFWWLSARRHTN